MTIAQGRQPALMPALVLAYLGDAVYELSVRSHLVAMGYSKVDLLHKQAIKYVNAETQAKVLRAVAGTLSDEEAAVVRRGRNAKSGSAPKNISISEYRHGTALESLIGYLYLSGREDRISEIIDIAIGIVSAAEEKNKK